MDILTSNDWGEAGAPYKLSDLVFTAIQNESGVLQYKSSVHRDMHFHDAVEQAFVILGIDSDEFPSPYFHDMGHEFEIKW